MPAPSAITGLLAAMLLPGFFTPVAQAANGIQAIGFGVESTAMGGADLALSRDAMALNNNPAGLGWLTGRRFDLAQLTGWLPALRHRDAFGNDSGVANDPVFGLEAAYAQPLARKFVAGAGVFIQGGAGAEFAALNTAFGTRDELSSLFFVARFAAGLAWQASPALSLGATLAVDHARLEQRFFPATSAFDAQNPARSFFGYRLDDAQSLATSARFGLQYRPHPDWRFGAAFGTASRADFEDATLTLNTRSLGLGETRYRDTALRGFGIPQQFGIGFAWQASPRWLLALDVDWLDWSDSMSRIELDARQADSPLAPPRFSAVSDLDWRDQYVLALGAEYAANDALRLRAGFNYARNPVPASGVLPFLAPIGERHLTLGFETTIATDWEFGGSLEHQFSAEIAYDNPGLPFGPASARVGTTLLRLGVARHW